MIKKGTNVSKLSSKRFKLDTRLQQINFLDSRVYKRSDDLYYPSVTAVLTYYPKGEWFDMWRKSVGYNADLIMRLAGEEGTQVHNAIEERIEGKELEWIDTWGTAQYNEKVWGMILKYVDFHKTYNPEILFSEEFLYSDKFQYAGTADLLMEIDGEVWLIDIKTSNQLQKSMELQLAAYGNAYTELSGKQIDRYGIMWLKSPKRGPSKKPGVIQGAGWELKEVHDIERAFELFKYTIELYREDHPICQPIYKSYPTSISL